MKESTRLLFIKLLWYPRYYFYYRLFKLPLKVGYNPNISRHSILEFVIGGEISIGNNCLIDHYAVVSSHGGKIEIGDNFSLGPHSVIYGAKGGLKIENNVLIGAHTIVVPVNHTFKDRSILINKQGYTAKGVTIMSDVWIGANCTILDGITIGKGVVIGAGSVVTKSINNYSIVVGNPAKLIGVRE